MNIAGLIFLILAHYISGKGLLRLFGVRVGPVTEGCLSVMTGVPMVSLAPCFLQLVGLPISPLPAMGAVVVMTGLFGLPLLRRVKRPSIPRIPSLVYYEFPFLVACGFLLVLAAWRSFYYPPYARDMLAGPELLAEYAVREHTMISSVFSIDLQSTNNYFKSPYITSLQILYKLFVCPFGQVWLSLVAIPFVIWLYTLLRARIHPLIAGFLLFFFMTIPEVYAYSYVMLYDYSNMVFFFAGFYFLLRFLQQDDVASFAYAAFLFGLATYIRTETLLLLALLAPVVVLHQYRRHSGLAVTAKRLAVFFLIPGFFYLLCIHVFVRLFVPIPFEVSDQIRASSGNAVFLLMRLKGMLFYLIFSMEGIRLFGYFIFFFCAILLMDAIVFRRFTTMARNALYGVLVIFIGLALLGYLVPLVDLENTTKRGVFKFLPLMLLYLADSESLQRLSGIIATWEKKHMKEQPARAEGEVVDR